jgi:hypothetical protein
VERREKRPGWAARKRKRGREEGKKRGPGGPGPKEEKRGNTIEKRKTI